jgi:hypothetical protein
MNEDFRQSRPTARGSAAGPMTGAPEPRGLMPNGNTVDNAEPVPGQPQPHCQAAGCRDSAVDVPPRISFFLVFHRLGCALSLVSVIAFRGAESRGACDLSG